MHFCSGAEDGERDILGATETILDKLFTENGVAGDKWIFLETAMEEGKIPGESDGAVIKFGFKEIICLQRSLYKTNP